MLAELDKMRPAIAVAMKYATLYVPTLQTRNDQLLILETGIWFQIARASLHILGL